MIYILAPFSLNINTTARNRILSFYRALKAAGYDVIILSPPQAGNDEKLFIHSSLSTHPSLTSFDIEYLPGPNKVGKLLNRIKMNSETLWNLLNGINLIVRGCDMGYSSAAVKKYFREHKLMKEDIIIASAPPFSVFRAAVSLTQKYRQALILDYRHVWTYGYSPIDNTTMVGKLKQYFGKKLEENGLQLATTVNIESESSKTLFPLILRNKIQVIRNGANLDFIQVDKILDHYPEFRIVYLGTVYHDQLKDESFFIAVKNFIRNNNILKGSFKVIFIGSNKNQRLFSTISQYGLEDFVSVTPRLELIEAMEIAYTASMFLHLKYHTHTLVDTSKHLDYLALQKPILLPVSDEGNIAKSIREHNSGIVCKNARECENTLDKLWNKHQNGESFKIKRNADFLFHISREAEAQKLVKSIKKLLEDRSKGPSNPL